MYKEIQTLAGEITSLSVLITMNTKADVFVRYYGHVNNLEVDINPDGWEENMDKVITSSLSLDGDKNEVIKSLTRIKQNLITIGLKNKLNYSKLNYEIEEVKNYRLD